MSETARDRVLGLLEKLESVSRGEAKKAAGELRLALTSGPAVRSARAETAGSKIPPERVTVTYNQPWTNYQGNVQQAAVERQYYVGNRPSGEWTDGLQNVRLVVQESEADGRALRSAGSTWSSSPVSQTPLYLIQCSGLSGAGPKIDASDLAEGVDPALIAHVQAGTLIQSVNEYLEQNGQSMKVMGGNAGQNIAGAAATGTHGSWIDRRPVADTIHAIGLVSAGGKAYWIEPASRPLTNIGFSAWKEFHIIRDDSLFSAAQVSVGALGVVTSLVLDVDRLYFVDFTRVVRALDAPLKKAVYHLDLSDLGLGDKRPAHFQVVLNPHRLDEGQTGAFMETGFAVPPSATVPPPQVETPSFTEMSSLLTGDDPWTVLAELISNAPYLVPSLLELILPFVFPAMHVVGPLSKVWPRNVGGPPLISTEFAVPQDKVEQTLDLLRAHMEAAKPGFFWPGVFGIRFGKQTGALLGFTRFERWCTMELIYLRGVRGVEGFLGDFYSAMRKNGIPHGIHWGQVNFLTAEQVLDGYGEQALSDFRAARRRLGAGGQVFANAATDSWGLTGPADARPLGGK